MKKILLFSMLLFFISYASALDISIPGGSCWACPTPINLCYYYVSVSFPTCCLIQYIPQGTPCGYGVCDGMGNCVAGSGPLPGPCDDNNICTVNDYNYGYGCVGVPIDCDDNDPYTIDTCMAMIGCMHIPIPSPVCGDGIVHSSEECDDYNHNNGDGCSSTCTVEQGYYCEGSPSVCSQAIPEFGVIAAGLALIGAIAIFVIRRR
ncbi:MAG: myxococcus cysteine-rich repeat containing protein [Candidatus Woesearchaeota archaeon]